MYTYYRYTTCNSDSQFESQCTTIKQETKKEHMLTLILHRSQGSQVEI